MKKFFRALATAVMAAVLSVTCLGATGALAADYSKTVTFKGVSAGDEVCAYHVVSYDATYNNYEFESGFKSFVEGKMSGSSVSGKTVEEYFAGLSTAERSQLLDEYSASCSASKSWPSDVKEGVAGADLTCALTLDPGYYVVIAKTTAENSTVYTPTSVFVQVQGTSVTVYGGKDNALLDGNAPTVELKHQQGPTISKCVWDEAASTWTTSKTTQLGDIEYFYINVTVPAYGQDTRSSNAISVPLTVTDTMTNMALYTNLSGAPVRAMTTADGNGTEIAGAIKSYNWNAETGELKVELDFNVVEGRTFYLCYGARTTAASASANRADNTAVLNYANPVTGEEKVTEPVKNNLWLFSLNLLKVDGKGTPLDGAMFSVSESDAQNAKVISFVKEGNYYRPATDADADAAKVTEIPGNSVIKGLDAKAYTLKETSTPAGYYAPNGSFTATLVAEVEGDTVNGSLASGTLTGPDSLAKSAAVNASSNNQLDVTIANSTMPVLPSTGGMGTMLFTIGGVALMVVAAIAFMVIRKKGDQK